MFIAENSRNVARAAINRSFRSRENRPSRVLSCSGETGIKNVTNRDNKFFLRHLLFTNVCTYITPYQLADSDFFPQSSDMSSKCHECEVEIVGDKLRALGLVFHLACFNCKVCGKNLSSPEEAFKGDPSKNIYCLEDYNKSVKKGKNVIKPKLCSLY